MYKKLLFSTLMSLFCMASQASETTPLLKQLKNLNKYWGMQKNTFQLDPVHGNLGEKDLIQTHLLLVVKQLKQKTTDHLTISQQKHRAQLLQELKLYANQRIFPINSFHSKRTPYFIDEIGTACAVGHLIIKSGNEEFANFISQNNNYDFIEDMPHQKELLTWAYQYGFELDELKWIQPAYGPQCNPGDIIQPLCRDGVGCFNPDWQSAGLLSPVTYLSEFNDGTGWVIDSNNVWQFWGARIGQHRITITDTTNSSMVFNYTINNVPAIPISASVTDQSSGAFCNGQVSLSVNSSSGTTYYYELINTQMNYYKQATNGVFDSLCTGTYTARVSTSFNCTNSISVTVNNSTGLAQNNFDQFVNVQNPIQQYLTVDVSLSGRKQLKVFNLLGDLVIESSMENRAQFDLSELDDGLYILQIEFKGNVYNRKIVKAN